MLTGGLGFPDKSFHQCSHIHMVGFQRQWIGRKSLLLNGIDVGGHSLRYGKNQCDADNTDTAGKRSKRRSAFLGKQIFQRKAKGCTERHRGLLFLFSFLHILFYHRLIFFLFRFNLRLGERSRIAFNFTVQHTDDSRRIFFCKLRIMRNHNNQTVFRDFF